MEYSEDDFVFRAVTRRSYNRHNGQKFSSEDNVPQALFNSGRLYCSFCKAGELHSWKKHDEEVAYPLYQNASSLLVELQANADEEQNAMSEVLSEMEYGVKEYKKFARRDTEEQERLVRQMKREAPRKLEVIQEGAFDENMYDLGQEELSDKMRENALQMAPLHYIKGEFKLLNSSTYDILFVYEKAVITNTALCVNKNTNARFSVSDTKIYFVNEGDKAVVASVRKYGLIMAGVCIILITLASTLSIPAFFSNIINFIIGMPLLIGLLMFAFGGKPYIEIKVPGTSVTKNVEYTFPKPELIKAVSILNKIAQTTRSS